MPPSGVTTDPKTGLPIFGSATPVNQNDPTNIWFSDLPSDLQGVSNLWYNIKPASKGHVVELPNAPVLSIGDGISELNPAIPGTGSHAETVGAHGSQENMVAPADILKQVAALESNDPEKLASIQALMSSGVWGTVNVNGVFDTHTENALINAMQRYYKITHGTGAAMSFMQYLQSAGTRALQAKQQASASGGSAGQVALQDPATIAQYTQSAAQTALGENLSQAQIDKFVQQFQAEQQAAQLSTSGSYTSPDLSSEAMAFVQNSNPGAYQANSRMQYEDALANLMGANRPNPSEPVSPVGGK